MDPATGLTVWLPLISGILTVVASVYGLHRTWQDRRREQRGRLAEAAGVAVRLAEAAYVRPLLRTRLDASVHVFLSRHAHHHHPTTARLRLFCQLQADVRLQPEEKRAARARAYDELVELLRAMSHPPVRVPPVASVSSSQITDPPDHDRRLLRALEVAYNLTPRPAGVLIAELGAFAGHMGALRAAGEVGRSGAPPTSPY